MKAHVGVDVDSGQVHTLLGLYDPTFMPDVGFLRPCLYIHVYCLSFAHRSVNTYLGSLDQYRAIACKSACSGIRGHFHRNTHLPLKLIMTIHGMDVKHRLCDINTDA